MRILWFLLFSLPFFIIASELSHEKNPFETLLYSRSNNDIEWIHDLKWSDKKSFNRFVNESNRRLLCTYASEISAQKFFANLKHMDPFFVASLLCPNLLEIFVKLPFEEMEDALILLASKANEAGPSAIHAFRKAINENNDEKLLHASLKALLLYGLGALRENLCHKFNSNGLLSDPQILIVCPPTIFLHKPLKQKHSKYLTDYEKYPLLDAYAQALNNKSEQKDKIIELLQYRAMRKMREKATASVFIIDSAMLCCKMICLNKGAQLDTDETLKSVMAQFFSALIPWKLVHEHRAGWQEVFDCAFAFAQLTGDMEIVKAAVQSNNLLTTPEFGSFAKDLVKSAAMAPFNSLNIHMFRIGNYFPESPEKNPELANDFSHILYSFQHILKNKKMVRNSTKTKCWHSCINLAGKTNFMLALGMIRDDYVARYAPFARWLQNFVNIWMTEPVVPLEMPLAAFVLAANALAVSIKLIGGWMDHNGGTDGKGMIAFVKLFVENSSQARQAYLGCTDPRLAALQAYLADPCKATKNAVDKTGFQPEMAFDEELLKCTKKYYACIKGWNLMKFVCFSDAYFPTPYSIMNERQSRYYKNAIRNVLREAEARLIEQMSTFAQTLAKHFKIDLTLRGKGVFWPKLLEHLLHNVKAQKNKLTARELVEKFDYEVRDGVGSPDRVSLDFFYIEDKKENLDLKTALLRAFEALEGKLDAKSVNSQDNFDEKSYPPAKPFHVGTKRKHGENKVDGKYGFASPPRPFRPNQPPPIKRKSKICPNDSSVVLKNIEFGQPEQQKSSKHISFDRFVRSFLFPEISFTETISRRLIGLETIPVILVAKGDYAKFNFDDTKVDNLEDLTTPLVASDHRGKKVLFFDSKIGSIEVDAGLIMYRVICGKPVTLNELITELRFAGAHEKSACTNED